MAAKVVLGNHEVIGLDSCHSEERLEMLLHNVSTIAAIYHKDPKTLRRNVRRLWKRRTVTTEGWRMRRKKVKRRRKRSEEEEEERGTT